MDFLIRLDFAPTALQTTSGGLRILSQEGGNGTEPNIIALVLRAVGTDNVLQFQGFGSGNVNLVIPTTGTNGFLASGDWFHAAFAYNGDETSSDNVSLYWTKVNGVADATSVANLIGTATVTSDVPTVLSGPGPEFNFGTITSNKALPGAIDEFRISNIGRTADQFIFVPEPSSIMLATISLIGMGLIRMRSKQ